MIAPTGPGPEPGTTGGELQRWESFDAGVRWKAEPLPSSLPGSQHSYLRKPYQAHPQFRALWAEASSLNPSPSSLYYMDHAGHCARIG